MKKVICIFIACATICFGACACGGQKNSTPENTGAEAVGDTKPDVPSDTAADADEEKVICSYITAGDVTLNLGGELTEDILSALGEPDNLIQAPSCHYDGTDNIYYYPGLTFYTYIDGEKAVLYSIDVSDGIYPTPEGVKVGMTLSEVEDICGDGFEDLPNGISYSLGDGMELNFRAENETVTVIEYYME